MCVWRQTFLKGGQIKNPFDVLPRVTSTRVEKSLESGSDSKNIRRLQSERFKSFDWASLHLTDICTAKSPLQPIVVHILFRNFWSKINN